MWDSGLLIAFICSRQLVAAASPVSNEAQEVCDEIHAAAPSRLAYSPHSSKALFNNADLKALYHATRTTYWDAANDSDFPACILFPESAEDVAVAIRALAKQPSVPFATKSGGHNWNRGFSSTNGGVLLSFRPNLQSTTLASDGHTAQVGAGARWHEAMSVLDPSKKCIVGGRAGDVGVGGYLLQGGISYLSAQYGFACDNVVEYEMVTANGTILNINNSSHPDIFWALRGGGNAFGVVTRYTLKAYDIGQVWGGDVTYNVTQLARLNTAFSNFIAQSNDPRAALIYNWLQHQEGFPQAITISFFYDGAEPPPNVFAEFNAIPQVASTVKTQSYPDLLGTGSTSALGIRTSNAVSSLPNMPCDNTTSFLNWHWDQVIEAPLVQNFQQNEIVLVSMALQAIPVGLQQASAAQGPGALAMDPRNGDKMWIEYDVGWNHTTCDDHCPQALRQLVDQALAYQMRTYAGVKPTHYVSGDLAYVPYNPLFMNDAQYSQDVLGSYGTASFNRLKTLQKMLDPRGLLITRQKGFFFN